MAKNPNELSKIMNEMANALQELSDSQLESVQSILANQKDLIEKEKKVKKAKAKLEKEKASADKKSTKDTKSIIEKTLEQKNAIMSSFNSDMYELKTRVTKSKKVIKSLADRLGNSLVDGLGLRGTFDAYKSIKGALSNPKEFLKDRIFGTEDKTKISSILTIKKDLVLSHSNINNMNIGLKGDLKLNGTTINSGIQKTSQSLLNFDVESNDVGSQQLEVLKTINDKLDHLGVTGESGGLFDFLGNGLKEVLTTMAVPAAEVAAGGVGAISLTAILSKYVKAVPGISKMKGVVSAVKSAPKTKIGIGAALLGGAGLIGYNALSDDETPVEQKLEGGKVESGKPYIVGEGGKELFVPNSDGFIVPNNKSFALTKDDISKLKLSQTNRSSQFIDSIKDGLSAYNKPFTTSLTTYFNNFDKDYKEYKEDTKTSLSSMFDLLGNAANGVKHVASSALNAILSNLTPTPQTNNTQSTQTNDPPSTPSSNTSVQSSSDNSDYAPPPIKLTTSMLTNDYKVPGVTEPNEQDNMNAKADAFLSAYKSNLKLNPPYEPAVKSNIIASPWGI